MIVVWGIYLLNQMFGQELRQGIGGAIAIGQVLGWRDGLLSIMDQLHQGLQVVQYVQYEVLPEEGSLILLTGLLAGILAGLLSGGLACCRHGILRLLLRRADDIPRNYPRFLDYVSERILLSKAGGGYIFIHRLLLDYFASLRTIPDSDALAEGRQQTHEPVDMSSTPLGLSIPEDPQIRQ